MHGEKCNWQTLSRSYSSLCPITLMDMIEENRKRAVRGKLLTSGNTARLLLPEYSSYCSVET